VSDRDRDGRRASVAHEAMTLRFIISAQPSGRAKWERNLFMGSSLYKVVDRPRKESKIRHL
jgi:hypothetical protein